MSAHGTAHPAQRWRAPLFAVALGLAACSDADQAGANEAGAAREGAGDASDAQLEAIEQLEAIGYASGTQRASALEGVTQLDRERVVPGLNFFTSGHEPGALLMDLDGRVLHRWRRSLEEVWPEAEVARSNANRDFWRRAHLSAKGEVTAIFEGIGIFRVDADSKLLWAQQNHAHHDLELLPNGDIWVLTRTAHLVPRVHAQEPTLEDFLTLLGPEGEEKRRISVLECFERGGYPAVWRSSKMRQGDVLHTNTLHVIDARHAALHPFLEPGFLLIASPRVDLVALVDPARERVVRIWRCGFFGLHDPKILDDGNMLVFDNQGAVRRSRVVELDPSDSQIVWQYQGRPERPFFTKTCGAAQRLPGGNTLVTESDNGRAFELSRDGTIVWEFHSPFRVGEDRELVATLFELLRLPPDFPVDWAAGFD